MTRIYTPLITECLDNDKYVSLHAPFGFNSDVMKKNKLRWLWRPPEPYNSQFPEKDGDIWAPAGFVYDFESIPKILRGPTGENKRGGTGHDVTCRAGVIATGVPLVCPGMTKSIAADIYFEIMTYTDAVDFDRFKNHPLIPNFIIRSGEWARRHVKSNFVRVWPGNFFQHYALDATAKEIAGLDCDPYVTLEKLKIMITKNKEMSEALKDVDVDTESMVIKTDEVTEDLKEAKEEVRGEIDKEK